MSELVEKVARAMCRAQGIDPDYCTHGSGYFISDGMAGFECHTRAWQEKRESARAAFRAILAAADVQERALHGQTLRDWIDDMTEELGAGHD